MTKPNSNRINVVYADSSSVFDKKQLLERSGYFRRTRWERSTVIDVLEGDSKYIELMNTDKE